ncbi:FISUMP domain-containing protein [Balneolaceae bacterium ANBcel3]|nr:FISUMP domain-containing protein [Balneolaceae bacterium ANBcel3]
MTLCLTVPKDGQAGQTRVSGSDYYNSKMMTVRKTRTINLFLGFIFLLLGSVIWPTLDTYGQTAEAIHVRLSDEQGRPVENALIQMRIEESESVGPPRRRPMTIYFRHLRDGRYESRGELPSGENLRVRLMADAPGFELENEIWSLAELKKRTPVIELKKQEEDDSQDQQGQTDPHAWELQPDPQDLQTDMELFPQTDQGTIVDDGILIAVPTEGTNLENSRIRLTSSAGVPLETADVRFRFEDRDSPLGRSVSIELSHEGRGRYRASQTPVGADAYRVSVQVMADDHQPIDKIVSENAAPPVTESINVFHNNYFERCLGRLDGRPHTYPDSPWNDCTVDADRLIESFGTEQRDIRYTITNRTSMYPVYKYAPDIDHAIENIEIYAARENAYESILEQLFRGTALTLATAQSQELSDWLDQHMRTNDDLSKAALSARGTQLIAGFSETLQDFGEAFELIGATLDLERAFRQGSMDGVLMYLAYQSTAGDILDRLELMIRHSDSWLANDEALQYALRDIRFEFEQTREENMEQMARAVANNTVTETVGNILLGMALKTALNQAGITVASLVTGKAAPAVVAGSVKVAVALVVIDFIQSALRAHEQRTLLATALQMDRYLLEGVPDRFESGRAGRYGDEQLTDMLIRMQLGLLFNEARAAMYAGEHRTWIGYQFRYSEAGAVSPTQAYELRMVEISREKSARAEADLERLAQEIFRRQRIEEPVTDRKEDKPPSTEPVDTVADEQPERETVSPPSVGDWPRDTDTEIVEVTNPATGRVWMDRNLGASRVATSSTDSQAYGDLYQWGRPADGHQKRNSPTSSTSSSSDQPGHRRFILSSRDANWDWRSPQNDDLWQGVNGINNPCPVGYRLPTEAEWNAERSSWSSNNASGAFASPLNLPLAGRRGGSSGSLFGVGSYGLYWSSSVSGSVARDLFFISSNANMYSSTRAFGLSVRCTKD